MSQDLSAFYDAHPDYYTGRVVGPLSNLGIERCFVAHCNGCMCHKIKVDPYTLQTLHAVICRRCNHDATDWHTSEQEAIACWKTATALLR